ncbi:MAG TPA: TRAP transporter large permease [Alphaproteobacteria bacterium]|nr:TRAP transporter large permease [Alphaproteobacteria bacterium]
MLAAALGFGCVFLLLFAGVPVGFGMALVGIVGFAALTGWAGALNMMGQILFDSVVNYELSVLPLFVIMGNFVAQSRMAQELYDAGYAYLGHRKGGLAMATVIACGGFAAVCGSSLATAATISKVAMPQMRARGYADSLAAGAIAAGGTLGIMIPPSVILVIYGIMTETSIAKLFVAGIIPGALGILGYMSAIVYVTWRRPEDGPAGDRSDWRQRLRATGSVGGITSLFVLVIGGIYVGAFTPTEAAGIGAAGAFFLSLARRTLSARNLLAVLIDSGRTTSMIFAVLLGALMFANFLDVTGVPNALAAWVRGVDLPALVVIFVIVSILFVLGCILESLSMMLLTVPMFYPIVGGLGYDLVWFGIVVVLSIEISLITPPIGLNIFVLRATLQDVPTGTIFRGVLPFIFADIGRLAVIILIPWLSLVLPGMMS